MLRTFIAADNPAVAGWRLHQGPLPSENSLGHGDQSNHKTRSNQSSRHIQTPACEHRESPGSCAGNYPAIAYRKMEKISLHISEQIRVFCIYVSSSASKDQIRNDIYTCLINNLILNR